MEEEKSKPWELYPNNEFHMHGRANGAHTTTWTCHSSSRAQTARNPGCHTTPALTAVCIAAARYSCRKHKNNALLLDTHQRTLAAHTMRAYEHGVTAATVTDVMPYPA